jgi:hypothetical protein
MEQEAIRHAIDYDRWEASALFAEALTGIKPPPKLEPACGWPTIGSVALESLHRADIGVKEAADINDCKQEMSSRDVTNYGDINDCKQEMSSRVFPVDAPVEGQVNAVTMCDGAGRGGDGVGMGHGVVFEEAGAGDGTEAVLPPFWQVGVSRIASRACVRVFARSRSPVAVLVVPSPLLPPAPSPSPLPPPPSSLALVFRMSLRGLRHGGGTATTMICRATGTAARSSSRAGATGRMFRHSTSRVSLRTGRSSSARRARPPRSSSRNTWTQAVTRPRATSRRGRWKI